MLLSSGKLAASACEYGIRTLGGVDAAGISDQATGSTSCAGAVDFSGVSHQPAAFVTGGGALGTDTCGTPSELAAVACDALLNSGVTDADDECPGGGNGEPAGSTGSGSPE